YLYPGHHLVRSRRFPTGKTRDTVELRHGCDRAGGPERKAWHKEQCPKETATPRTRFVAFFSVDLTLPAIAARWFARRSRSPTIFYHPRCQDSPPLPSRHPFTDTLRKIVCTMDAPRSLIDAATLFTIGK